MFRKCRNLNVVKTRLIIFILLIGGICGIEFLGDKKLETRAHIPTPISPQRDWYSYDVRDPIRIVSNGDFANQAAENGWAGDGSSGDPYIIENITINCHERNFGILIRDSTKYFEIRNCTIFNCSTDTDAAAIILRNTSNGTIIGNNCSDNGEHGILLTVGCKNNTISNNTACGNSQMGIKLAYSSNNNTIIFGDKNL